MTMEHLTDKAILNYALQNGIIDIYTIQKQIEMNERKRYLEMHNSKIWLSTDDKWYTFVPDLTKQKGKRLIKRSTEEEIKDAELSVLDLTIFENVAWLMIKNAGEDIPATPDEWLDTIDGVFSVYEVLPQILEMWEANLATTSAPRKK